MVARRMTDKHDLERHQGRRQEKMEFTDDDLNHIRKTFIRNATAMSMSGIPDEDEECVVCKNESFLQICPVPEVV
jgi:hypothetical protein